MTPLPAVNHLQEEKMNRNLSISTDPDRAADALAGFLADPDQKRGDWPSRFQEADEPYVLRALLRQAHLLEVVRNRLLLDWATCKSAQEAHRLLRQARNVAIELKDNLGAIYKLQRDAQAGFSPAPTSLELALADSPPPAEASAAERVTAADQADEVFEREFAGLMNEARSDVGPILAQDGRSALEILLGSKAASRFRDD